MTGYDSITDRRIVTITLEGDFGEFPRLLREIADGLKDNISSGGNPQSATFDIEYDD